MTQLLPIIRRARRPLVVVDASPRVVDTPESARVIKQGEDGEMKQEDGGTPLPATKASDAKVISKGNERQAVVG